MYEITYQEILERMLNRVSDKFDKREGSVIYDTHSPTAIELQILYMYLNEIIGDMYGDTASREFLILRCKERGIYPDAATYAVLKGVFTPDSVDVIGKRFNINELNYIVLGKNDNGGYRVQCETEGTVGNRYLGQMIPIEYVDGLETAELTEVLIPGEDEEDTESLRTRYFESFDAKAYGGNIRDYLEKTNAIPGVGATKVTRIWNGDISPKDLIPGETVKSWYNGIVETLEPEPKAWLQAIYTAAANKKLTTGGTILLTILNSEYSPPAPELIQTVQTAIDPEVNAGEGYGLAPIGHVVTVEGATPITINVTTTVTFDSGYSWSNLQQSINEAVKSYLLELRKSWAEASYLVVRVSQIETRILGVQGVVDITNTQINGDTDNLTLGKYEVPILGRVSE